MERSQTVDLDTPACQLHVSSLWSFIICKMAVMIPISGYCEVYLFFKFIYFGCAGSSLWHVGSLGRTHRLSCPSACGILVPRSGMEPQSPALEGRFLITGPPGKSLS